MEPSGRLREALLVESSFGNDSLNNYKPPYTYMNRQARPSNNSKQKTIRYIIKEVVVIYHKNDIEPYKSRCLGQQQIVGEKSTVILYNHINRRAGTPNTNTKQKRHDNLRYNSICYIGPSVRI